MAYSIIDSQEEKEHVYKKKITIISNRFACWDHIQFRTRVGGNSASKTENRISENLVLEQHQGYMEKGEWCYGLPVVSWKETYKDHEWSCFHRYGISIKHPLFLQGACV